jgi:hypothetical protein
MKRLIAAAIILTTLLFPRGASAQTVMPFEGIGCQSGRDIGLYRPASVNRKWMLIGKSLGKMLVIAQAGYVAELMDRFVN